MKVHLLIVEEMEWAEVISAHSTWEGAVKAWDKKRIELLEEQKGWVKKGMHFAKQGVEVLSCTDPKKMEFFYDGTPRIKTFEVVP